ncbi:MAG TPA: ABC transporter permease [Terriglobales bacterium]|nr:ABC transporter permease [Terriglobales bacterium]
MKQRTGSRNPMFFRMLMRATMVKPGRVISALVAVVVAASVATAMMNLYVDVQAKLRKEFRSYGANVVVVAREGQTLPVDALSRVESVIGNSGLAVPFAFAVTRTDTGAPIVVAGTDMERVRKLNSWWSVTAWPSAAHSALLGTRAASVVSPGRKPFNINFEGRKLQLMPAGILRTGAAEDSRIYLDLKEFTAWTGVPASTIEIGVNGTPAEINAVIGQLANALPAAEVKPVRQIVEGEARVLGKTRAALLAAVAMIILTAALCVLATLTAWVLDRRRDFAIMKALGASERVVNGFFAAEAAALGAAGAVLGFAIGIGVAAWIGRVNFHAAVVPRFAVFPAVFAGSVALALISAVLPISLLRRVQPATILRGE